MLGLHFNDVMADFYHRSVRLSVRNAFYFFITDMQGGYAVD